VLLISTSPEAALATDINDNEKPAFSKYVMNGAEYESIDRYNIASAIEGIHTSAEKYCFTLRTWSWSQIVGCFMREGAEWLDPALS
jgi:hypothetical protein